LFKNSLEYGVALLMNLCLRTNGRKKCAEIAEQAITTLSTLLAHPDHDVYLCFHTKTHFYCFLYVYIQIRPYINSSLYSILTLKSIRDKAIELKLDNRLRTLIRTEKNNSETKGQLEFLLNLLYKGGNQMVDQSSDTEQDNEDVKYFY